MNDCILRVGSVFQPSQGMNIAFCLSQAVLLIAFCFCVFRLPRGVWKTHAKVSEDEEAKEALEDIKKKLQIEELDLVRSDLSAPTTPQDRFSATREKVFRAIDYAIKRHDWYEDQRARIFQIILAISGLALTILGFFVKDVLKDVPHFLPSYCSIAGFFLIILITLSVAVFQYNKELDADRPYRSISDIRFWFFRYNLPLHSSAGKEIDDIQSRAKAVAGERRRFFKRIVENFYSDKSLREDLEQLFILQVLQLYKTESLTRLRWLLAYGVLVLPLQFALCFWALWMAARICSLHPS
jgi:hypothetical protein